MKLILLALAATTGAWSLQQQAELPRLVFALGLIPVFGAAWLVRKVRWPGAGVCAWLLWMLAAAGGGFFWAAANAHLSLASSLDERWYGRDVVLEGVIADLTQPGDQGVRFVFDVERTLAVGARVPPRISLTWYEGWSGKGVAVPELLAGQRWRLIARLRPPHGNYNSHGFDAEAWMLQRGIRAGGYVREGGAATLLSAMVWRPGYAVDRAREHIRQRFVSVLGERHYAGVLIALAIGDQRAIAPAQWELFTRAGVNHLVSISGLHITLVSGMVFWAVLRVWRRSGSLSQRLAPLRAATLAGFAFAVGYAALAGFAIPAQRAICMLGVVALALWSGRHWSPATVLGFALFAVLVFNPMAVSSGGFWLSFAAVAAIVLTSAVRRDGEGKLMQWARIQWSITLMLLPLLLVLFQQVSLISPIANAIAIPVFSLLVAPLALLMVVLPLEIIATVAHEVLSACMGVLNALAALPLALLRQHAPVPWTIPFALAGTALMLLPRGFPARWLGIVLLLPIFTVKPDGPLRGELWLTVLDVGQGLAAVLRTAKHTVLFDAGPDYRGAGDAGSRIVVPYLRAVGVGRIDRMIVSHDDLDHAGGATSVAAALRIGIVMSSFADPASNSPDALHLRCETGQSWTSDDVRFDVLHPAARSYQRGDVSDNDRSCVLRVESKYGSAILTADIERRSEQQLIAGGARLDADVLVVPHHGSRTSSSTVFVDAVRPRWAVFPVGYANAFGHPHPLVEARYRDAGATLLRTDRGGAVTLKFTGAGIIVTTWRQMNRRYWHERID